MRLQQIVWKVPPKIETLLYYRIFDADGLPQNVNRVKDTELILDKGDSVRFDTYFNSFSIKKWRKYSRISCYSVKISGKGRFIYRLMGADIKNDKVELYALEEKDFFLSGEEPVFFKIPDREVDVCYPVFESVEDNSKLITIEYSGETNIEPRMIRLAIDICTFKREAYLKRNIQILRDKIILNEDSLLHDRVQIFVSDNAGTLGDMFENYPCVYVLPNENVGGVGGFTRGIIEAVEHTGEKPFTHVLIMDDDVIIEPTAIERTYALLANLKNEYYNATVGGALLRENTPYMQFEAGASWNRGKIIANHHHYDLRDFSIVVENELEEKVEYTGWWYSVIPVDVIENSGLPLPLFIHRDDIEYGIRAGKEQFILMNGIAVWHEAFENKMPGATEYYDLRNMAIINSIHYPNYSKKELKRFLRKWVIANIVRYRYEYVAMNLLGIHDFCQGVDWFMEQDGQVLHQKIMQMNYSAKPATEYIGYKGIKAEDIRWEHLEQVQDRKVGAFERICKIITMNGCLFPANGIKVVRPHNNIYDLFRIKEVLYVDSAGNGLLLVRDLKKAKECYKKLKQMLKEIDQNFERARLEYAERYQQMITKEFWKQYLKIE